MPRNPSGQAAQPAGTSAIFGFKASSSNYNQVISDIYSIFNQPWPVSLSQSLAALGGQPLDASLTSLSALATGANKIAYTTGANVWAETSITAFGRSLIDDADAIAARTTIGAQASDAILTNLSGLTFVAGDKIYATAADTFARLPKGTSTQISRMNAAATAPEYGPSLPATGTAPLYPARAWCEFTGSGSAVLRSGGNVASVTRTGVGAYTINFVTALPNANYGYQITALNCMVIGFTRANSSFSFTTANTNTGAAQDAPFCTVSLTA